MFGNPVNTGLSFTKVLGGISKTLNIANQVIPIYREAKPMINNARTILSVLKDVNKNPGNNKNTKVVNNNKQKDSIVESKLQTSNNPVFFL